MSDTSLNSLDPALVEQINREYFVETPVEPADLLFVFGTRHGVPEFVGEAARLWRMGYYRHAVVSGGATAGIAEPEADVIKRCMVEAGVPAHIILTEDRATNTGESVIFSLPILDAHIGLANIHSLVAIGKFCTSRRYLMTLERHWPDVRKMLVGVESFGYGRNDWHLHPYGRERVLREYSKIEPYLRQGFIVPWPSDSRAAS